MRIQRSPATVDAMRRTLSGLPVADVVLAVVLLGVKLVTVATGVQQGAGTVSYLAAPLWTLPLALRSRHPVAVATVISVTNIVELVLVGYHDSVVSLVALVLVTYSLGAHAASGGRVALGLASIVVSGLSSTAAQGRVHATSLLGDAAVLLGPLFAGLWARQQRLRTRMLEQLAAQLDREREERARAAVAEERARIARELHDEVAHAMSVIAVQADAAEGALARNPELVARPLVAIRETARAALADMRRVVGRLSTEPAPLEPEPGLARAADLVEQARAGGIAVELRIEGNPVPLPPALDLAAYRVVQEGLTNVRKHARARHVEVALRYGRDRLAVEVTDDGDGSGGGGGSGRGLVGIRERVSLLGGEVVAGSHSTGFVLRVTLPLQ
jgi:signal transduction histidine kinase